MMPLSPRMLCCILLWLGVQTIHGAAPTSSRPQETAEESIVTSKLRNSRVGAGGRKLFNVDDSSLSLGGGRTFSLTAQYSDSDTSGTTWIDDWGNVGTPQDVVCKVMDCVFNARTDATLQFSLKASSNFNNIDDGSVATATNGNCPISVSTTAQTGEHIYTMITLRGGNSRVSFTYECAGSPTPTPAPAPGPEPSPPEENPDMGCFSAVSTVEVRNKGLTAMKDLQVGDWVLVDSDENQYEPVYSFGHKHEDQEARFLQIHTATTTPAQAENSPSQAPPVLELTDDHLMYKVLASAAEEEEGRGGNSNKGGRMVPAGTIKVGDTILLNSQPVPVTKITSVTKRGVYMPLTTGGRIVVDGYLASTYVSLRKEVPGVLETADAFLLPFDDLVMQWWLSPYRMLCLGVSANVCKSVEGDWNDHESGDGIIWWLKVGRTILHVAEVLPPVLRVILMGLPALILFGVLNISETILGGPAVAPLLAFMMGACLYFYHHKRQPATLSSIVKGTRKMKAT